ncbi:putative ribonuclease H-like domain-containing protein [Tanacetum coccineum]
MYSFNLENIVPLGGLACLIAKATSDESNLWHRRLGHVNFKILNRLVKGNLVRGLPTKLFQNDHTCVACQKGKQHKASCKAKLVSSISHTLQLLHMDLFGPTSIRSINHKTYCLVITDDFSRFSWTFFLRSKDETSAILKDFIRQIENQLNQKVKTIRCDNGTEFKNRDINEFCGLKGIKREYSNARTPQQNGVAERKNRTLIEAARTMLADSFLPNTFWAEAQPHGQILLENPDELFLVGIVTQLAFDLDYLTDSMNYHNDSEENQANLHTGQQESKQDLGTKVKIDSGNSQIEDETDQDYFKLPIWHSYSSTNKSSSRLDGKRGSPREKEQICLDDLSRLQIQEKEASEEAEALRKNLDRETEIWICHQDATTDGILQHSSYDDEGAVADFTNLETVVNVSPIPTSRINPSHPSELILGDPTSAVQTRSKLNKKVAFSMARLMKKFYVSQPPGFQDPKSSQKVYKTVLVLDFKSLQKTSHLTASKEFLVPKGQTQEIPQHEVPFEQQPDLSPSPLPKPSPNPSPTPIIPDSIPEPTGENLGDHSFNDTSLSGNEDAMTLQNVYDLCISLCKQVSDQAIKIELLKDKIKRLKKKATPVINHFKAYQKRISKEQRQQRKRSSKKKRVQKESVSKQGRKNAKGDGKANENTQSEGRTKKR